MIKTRQCQVAGHEMNSAIHICTYKDCALTSKWVCADCSFEQLHSHGQQNYNHIMKQKQFLEFTVSQSQAIFDQSNQYAELIQQCIKQLDQFVQLTVTFKNLLEKDLGRVNKLYKISELENIKKIVNNEFQKLEKQQIELIINLKNNQPQFAFNLYQDLIKQVIMQVQKLQLLITVDDKQRMQEQLQLQQAQIQLVQSREQQQGQQEKLQIQTQHVQVKYKQIKQEKGQIQIEQVQQAGQQQISLAKKKQDLKYEYTQVQDNNQKTYSDYMYCKTKGGYILASQISEDEKYLAIGGDNCKLHVYELNTKQQIKQLEIKKSWTICRFTKDSRYLICGNSSGYLYCYDVSNNFSQLYKKQIHQDKINDILVINNNQIVTCSDDKSIIITNMPSLENNLKHLNPQTDQALQIHHYARIYRIDYDYDKDLIISYSLSSYTSDQVRYENSNISFFMKQNGNKIFKQQVAHHIQQIQIIPNNKIIGSDFLSLIIWQIDYDLKLLNKIREFKQCNYNFTFIDKSKIIIVCQKQLCIFDDNFNLLYSQDHGLMLNDHNYFKTRQINSTKYIIIQKSDINLKYKLEIKVIKRE